MGGAAVARTLALIALLAASPAPPGAWARKLLPADDGAKDPSWFLFRARLLDTVQRRDTTALLAVVDPAIRTGFGAEGGAGHFRVQWKLGHADSPLWHELGTILALGGKLEGSRFSAPYPFSHFPGDLDGFEHAAVVAENLRVRAAPDSTAAVIGRLSFDIVRLVNEDGGGADRPWRRIRLGDGRTGYVHGGFLRGPTDWRAIFARGPAGWRLEALVAGD